MAARRSRLSGDFQLRRTLRNIHGVLDNELKPVMQEAADKILHTMQELLPRSDNPRSSGHAADALQAFVSKSGLDAEIGLRGKKNNKKFFYLKFLEYGTKGYTGRSAPVAGIGAPLKSLTAATFSANTQIFQPVRRTRGSGLHMTSTGSSFWLTFGLR